MKTTQLQNLNEGDRFEIPSIKDTMKNLVVLRNSQCSVLVRGEKRESVNDSWTPVPLFSCPNYKRTLCWQRQF